MKKKHVQLIAVLIISLLLSAIPVFAASTKVTKSLDMPALNENCNGNGYKWNNSDRIFTMENMDLQTTDDYGIKLPAESTIELIGNNTITATRYGIHCFGGVTFIGSGTLTINVGDIGVRCGNTGTQPKLIFRSGSVTVKGAETGILTDAATVVFSGGTVKIDAKTNSIYSNSIQFVGGKAELKAPVASKGSIEINAMDLTVSASSCALTAQKGMSVSKEQISVGTSLDSLKTAEEYNGENAVRFVSTAKVIKKSHIFGEKVPVFVDYIVFSVIIIAAAAVVSVPILLKKKRTDALIKQSKIYKK